MFGQEEILRSRPGYELEADTCRTWADMTARAILLDEGDVLWTKSLKWLRRLGQADLVPQRHNRSAESLSIQQKSSCTRRVRHTQ